MTLGPYISHVYLIWLPVIVLASFSRSYIFSATWLIFLAYTSRIFWGPHTEARFIFSDTVLGLFILLAVHLFRRICAYRKYGPVRTLMQLLLGDKLGIGIAVILLATLLVYGWRRRKHGADTAEFAGTLSAFLMGASIALSLMPPFNQVLLILPLFILLRDWSHLPSTARVVFGVCVGWPWVTSLVMLATPTS